MAIYTQLLIFTLYWQIHRHFSQNVIAEKFDPEGNTLGHITAKAGNVDLFKA